MKNKIINITIVIVLCVFVFLRLGVACSSLQKQTSVKTFPIDVPSQYSGILPVASTPDIEIVLHLEAGTFLEARRHSGRHENFMATNGTWHSEDDTLYLTDSNGMPYTSFLVLEDELIIPEQEAATGRYNLKKLQEFASISAHHARLQSAGITFVSSGNEPFWYFRVGGEGEAEFSAPGSTENMAVFWEESDERGSTTKGWFKTRNGSLAAEVRNDLCRDTMSGVLFSHSVYIHFNDHEFTGCGSYL